MAKTIFILLDAVRSDYINENQTPFLWSCAKKGAYYRRVVPNFGFCERTEIITGQTPVESGFFTAIGYDPQTSPFKLVSDKKSLIFLDTHIPKNIKIPFLPKGGNVYDLFRKLVNRYIIYKTKISPQNIPLSLLHYWSLTEDLVDHRKDNAFSAVSLFDLLKKNNKSFFYDSFTALNIPNNGNDQDRIDMVLKDKKNNNKDLYFLYLGEIDFYGHEFGPKSKQVTSALKNLDQELKNFVCAIIKMDPNCNFLFLGDHGMAEVEKYLDVEKIINEISNNHNLKLNKDYIYFLDSTLVRIWFFNEDAKKIFYENFLNKAELLSNGSLITEEIAKKEKIPWGDKRYGDLIWWANTGVLIFPDFFHRTKMYKGMHGYDTNLEQNNGFCIVKGPNVENINLDKIHLTKIFFLLKNLLGFD